MDRKIRIIATDLDGTLLNSDKQITAKTYEALERAAAAGVEIVPITGRLLSAMPEQVRNLPFLNYIICVNGAQIIELATGKVIYKAEIPCARAVELMEDMDAYPAVYDCYIDGQGWMTQSMYDRVKDYAVDEHILELFLKYRTPVPDLKTYVRERNDSVQKVQMHFLTEQERKAMQPKLEKLWPDMALSSSFINNIEINSLDATKGAALAFLCDYLGVDVSQSMSFGDGTNDISMLKAAGIGVAMGNAMDEVKVHADYVTDTCDNDGMAKAIERFCF